MVQVGKLLRNGQSQTGGIVLGRGGGVEIPVKYGGLILRRNAAARVPDAHQSSTGLHPAVDGDAPSCRGVVNGNRFCRICCSRIWSPHTGSSEAVGA